MVCWTGLKSSYRDLVWWLVICAYCTSFAPFCGSQQVETNPEVLLEQVVSALGKSMEYYRVVAEENGVQGDELLGLRITADSLLWAIEECTASPTILVPFKLLESMKLLCAKLNVLLPRLVNIYQSRNLTKQYKGFLRRQYTLFHPYRSIYIEKENRKELPTMSSKGPPALSLMQSCIGDMSFQNKTCMVPEYCWEALQPHMMPGYMVTHQAMLLALTLMSGCQDKVNKRWKDSGLTLDELADSICFSLYPRVSSFHQSEFLPDEEGELFLDSFFACSLLGFEDFLHVAHMRISAILESQLKPGCFGFVRTDKGNEECIPRMSSSAIGELALYIRWLLHEKGFTLVYGRQPFKRHSWSGSIKLVILVLACVLLLVFFRRIQRGVQSILGRLIWFRK